jgi:nucleotide-binding universal stress UspA family protein
MLAREPESVIVVHVQRSGSDAVLELPGKSLTDGNGVSAQDAARARELNAEQIISFYKKELENTGPVRVTALVRDGVPSEEILRTAIEERVDLIIMGCSRKGGLHRAAAGRVTREVERSARVPVLIAKTNRSEKKFEYNWRGNEYAA